MQVRMLCPNMWCISVLLSGPGRACVTRIAMDSADTAASTDPPGQTSRQVGALISWPPAPAHSAGSWQLVSEGLRTHGDTFPSQPLDQGPPMQRVSRLCVWCCNSVLQQQAAVRSLLRKSFVFWAGEAWRGDLRLLRVRLRRALRLKAAGRGDVEDPPYESHASARTTTTPGRCVCTTPSRHAIPVQAGLTQRCVVGSLSLSCMACNPGTLNSLLSTILYSVQSRFPW